MAETSLHVALQRCESRRYLALAALEAYQVRFSMLAGPLPIKDAAELMALMDGIRDLLTGEGVPDVRP